MNVQPKPSGRIATTPARSKMAAEVTPSDRKSGKMSNKKYEKKLEKLQVELCYLQDWVRETGARVIIVCEGRDTAGKGGLIRRMTERVSPRTFRVVALSAPAQGERRKLFM